MNKSVCIFFFIFAFFIISSCTLGRKAELRSEAYKIEGFAQGTSYQITYYAESAIISSSSINQLFSELDSSLSIYKPYSLINQFNNFWIENPCQSLNWKYTTKLVQLLDLCWLELSTLSNITSRLRNLQKWGNLGLAHL